MKNGGKKMKKVLLLLLVTVLICGFALVGCATTTAAATTAAATTAAATTAAATTATEEFVIGYASMGDTNPFHALVSQGIEKEAAARGYKLIKVDNNWDSETTVNNIDELINQNVDIILCGLADSAIAPVIKEKVDAANIPLVFIDYKCEGVPAFGGNNVIAGGLGGEWLGKMAVEKWGGADLYIGLELPVAGELNELRMKEGFIDHMLEYVKIPEDKIYRLNGNNDIALSMQLVNDTITANPDAEHILIGCLADDDAQGALAAVEQLGYEDKVLICGQGFYDEVSAQNFLTEEPTAWGATVAYWPTQYGYFLFEKVDDFLVNGTPLPEEWNVEHVVVTRDNVQEILDQQ